MPENESNEKMFSRRDFLKSTGMFTGGIIGGSLLGGVVGYNIDGDETVEVNAGSETTEVEENNLQEARIFFRRQQDFEVLSAAVERIFPEDDNGPGAIALGVPYFIDRQLSTPWGINGMDYMEGPFREGEVPITRQDIYLEGLRVLDSTSEEEHDTAFSELATDQQDSILQQFENDEIELETINSSIFFYLLRQNTLEGVYSDPLYGGNRNMDGWRMKEYPGAQMSYRNMLEEDAPVDAEFMVIEPISLSENS